MELPQELEQQLNEGGHGPEVAARLLALVRATTRPAIRLHWTAVGAPWPRRSMLDVLRRKPAPRPAEALPRDASKLGGLPWLAPGEAWPRDPRGAALSFVAQLRLRELPPHPELPADGVLSIFMGNSPDVFGVRWAGSVRGAPAEPPADAPAPQARREAKLSAHAFEMFDAPQDLSSKLALPRRDSELELAVFDWVLELNGGRDGDDHLVLGHPGEHRELEELAKAAALEPLGEGLWPMAHALEPPAADPAERERLRLLLSLSFDRGFAPLGDNGLRLYLEAGDLRAGRLGRAIPLIHVG